MYLCRRMGKQYQAIVHVNVIGRKILIYATADKRIYKKSSHFSWKSKDTRQNGKVKEGSCQLKSRILSMSHQLNTELWTTVAQW